MSMHRRRAVPQGYELKKKKPIFKKVWFSAAGHRGLDHHRDGRRALATAKPPPIRHPAPPRLADGSAEAPAEAPADDPLSDGGWTASDIQVERTQFGDSITARVTNTEDNAQTGVSTLTVFGPMAHASGEYEGSANDVEAGQSATRRPSSTAQPPTARRATPPPYTYEFQNDL